MGSEEYLLGANSSLAVFLLEDACLPKFVQTDNTSSSTKTAIQRLRSSDLFVQFFLAIGGFVFTIRVFMRPQFVL